MRKERSKKSWLSRKETEKRDLEGREEHLSI